MTEEELHQFQADFAEFTASWLKKRGLDLLTEQERDALAEASLENSERLKYALNIATDILSDREFERLLPLMVTFYKAGVGEGFELSARSHEKALDIAGEFLKERFKSRIDGQKGGHPNRPLVIETVTQIRTEKPHWKNNNSACAQEAIDRLAARGIHELPSVGTVRNWLTEEAKEN